MKDPFAPLTPVGTPDVRSALPHEADGAALPDGVRPAGDRLPLPTPAAATATAGALPPVPAGLAMVDGTVQCTCGCGCVNPTAITADALATDRLARLAAATVRCADCRAPGHWLPPIDPDEQARLDASTAAALAADRLDASITAWRARVPAKFRDAPLDTSDAFMTDRADRFAHGSPTGFVVSGSYGTGKTWEVFGLLNHLVGRGLLHPGQILFGTEHDLLGAISMGSFDVAEAARARLHDPRYKVVFVDDVGQGKFRSLADAHALWYEVSDAFWRTDRIIIASTNFVVAAPDAARVPGTPASPFAGWVGEAAYDRIGAMTGYGVLEMGVGEDHNHRRRLSDAAEQAWRDAAAARRGTRPTG